MGFLWLLGFLGLIPTSILAASSLYPPSSGGMTKHSQSRWSLVVGWRHFARLPSSRCSALLARPRSTTSLRFGGVLSASAMNARSHHRSSSYPRKCLYFVCLAVNLKCIPGGNAPPPLETAKQLPLVAYTASPQRHRSAKDPRSLHPTSTPTTRMALHTLPRSCAHMALIPRSTP